MVSEGVKNERKKLEKRADRRTKTKNHQLRRGSRGRKNLGQEDDERKQESGGETLEGNRFVKKKGNDGN